MTPSSSKGQGPVQPGQPAPPFKLTAVKSGREVSPKDCAGYVLGLIFHGRETADAVTAVQRAVRTAHPDPSVTLASVVDLSAVPRLLRAAARPILEQIYDQAAQQIPKGLDPADYVFLLPDWDGSVTRAFGVRNQDKMAAIVVIDRQGIVVGAYQGPEPGQAALALVEQALARG